MPASSGAVGDGGCGALAEYLSFLRAKTDMGIGKRQKEVVFEAAPASAAKKKVVVLEPVAPRAAGVEPAGGARPFSLADLLCLRPSYARCEVTTYDEYIARHPRPADERARDAAVTVELQAEVYAAACQDSADIDDAEMELWRTPGRHPTQKTLHELTASAERRLAAAAAATPSRKLDLGAVAAEADVEAEASAAVLEDAVRSLKKEIEWREARAAASLRATVAVATPPPPPTKKKALGAVATPKRRALGDATNVQTC